METITESRNVIPQHLAIRSIRDSGYKSTAHAAAELIDNAVQAEASTVEVFIYEEQVLVSERQRWQIKQIAVVDNGAGMDPTTLRMALQFGNGTHLNDRKGIGRFGMGIPNSSISQCRRVDIWSWQAGISNAVTSHIDIDEVESGAMTEVPAPTAVAVPSTWYQASSTAEFSESGTVVLWSKLDRTSWKGSKATLDNIELLVGRIYRRFLGDGLTIRLAVVRGGTVASEFDRTVRINDPLYLAAPSSTPSPFDNKPMFRPYGETGEDTFPIEVGGEVHNVVVRFAWATDESRVLEDGKDAGKTPYGRHAGNNIGISVIRSGRELELSTLWASRDFRERWWGAEIEFPAQLDEIFGVTNNKQAATNFNAMAEYFADDTRINDWQEVRNEWVDDGDPRVHLIDICNRIATHRAQLRRLLRAQTSGSRTRSQKRHEDKVADRASDKFREREEDGHVTAHDETSFEHSVLAENLVDKGYAERTAREIADAIVEHERRVIFVTKDNRESTSFFMPEFIPGVTEIVFNTSHPAYPKLVEMLDPENLTDDVTALRTRIYSASDTLKMLLSAWARYELEEREGPRRERVAEVRQEWGKMARQFLAESDVDSTDPDTGAENS